MSKAHSGHWHIRVLQVGSKPPRKINPLGISTDSTNLPDPLFKSELLEVRAGGCGGLAPRPPGRSIQAPVFSVADLQLLQSPLNFQGPLLISELLEVRAGGGAPGRSIQAHVPVTRIQKRNFHRGIPRQRNFTIVGLSLFKLRGFVKGF